MRLTIIPIDGAVYKNEISFSGLDLSFIPANIHALQWYETEGEIEFINNPDKTKPQNQTITSLPEWALLALTKWEEAKEVLEAAMKKVATTNQPTTGLETA